MQSVEPHPTEQDWQRCQQHIPCSRPNWPLVDTAAMIAISAGKSTASQGNQASYKALSSSGGHYLIVLTQQDANGIDARARLELWMYVDSGGCCHWHQGIISQRISCETKKNRSYAFLGAFS